MINAGAIAIVSLLADTSPEVKLKRMLDVYINYVGHAVNIDEGVYRSEKETGHRIRAIGCILRKTTETFARTRTIKLVKQDFSRIISSNGHDAADREPRF